MVQQGDDDEEENKNKVTESKQQIKKSTKLDASNRLLALTGLGLALSLGVIAIAKFRKFL